MLPINHTRRPFGKQFFRHEIFPPRLPIPVTHVNINMNDEFIDLKITVNFRDGKIKIKDLKHFWNSVPIHGPCPEGEIWQLVLL